MLPHGEAVGHGLAEGGELAVYGGTRGQRRIGETGFQVALILAHAVALGGGGEVEIGRYRGSDDVHRPQGQVAHQPFGNLEEEAVAAFVLCRPMRPGGLCRLGPFKQAAEAAGNHAAKQAGVHFADEQVVAAQIEVRHAACFVAHGRVQPDERRTRPMQADEDFVVEIHALADDGTAVLDGQDGIQRINAEAAHAVFDVERPSVQYVPKIGDFAAVEPRFGHVAAVYRPPAHHGLRLRLCGFDKARDVGKAVLRVGINLQNVAETLLRRQFETPFHRTAFTAVHWAEGYLNAFFTQGLQTGAAVFARAVVHHQNGQAAISQGGNHLRQRAEMSVVGDNGEEFHDWVENGGKTGF